MKNQKSDTILDVVTAVKRRLFHTKKEEDVQKEEKRTLPYPLSIGFKSDVGKVRSLDEDSIVVVDFFSCYESQSSRRILAIVADGMGGHNKGELASKLATAIIVRELIPTLGSPNLQSKEDYESVLRESLLKANEEIIEYTLASPERARFLGMGTTASVAVIDNGQIHIGHVGDSRVYLLRNGMNQITKDHSLVQQLVDNGEITPEQAKAHPQRNVITRAIGANSNLEIDIYSRDLIKGDYVLLCCDGITNEIEDSEISRIVCEYLTPQKICDKLVELANSRGARDNISVIVVGPVGDAEPKKLIQDYSEASDSKFKSASTSNSNSSKTRLTENRFCPNCGQPNASDAKYCFYCKAEIEE